MKKKLFLLLLLFLFKLNVMAGAVAGPYVIWFNMPKNSSEVDRKVVNYLGNGDNFCWSRHALMFMHKKPSGITYELVDAAIFKKDKVAIKKINSILKHPFDRASSGFDGIVVYSEKNGPEYHSLMTGATHFESVQLIQKNLAESICLVMPEITRKPN